MAVKPCPFCSVDMRMTCGPNNITILEHPKDNFNCPAVNSKLPYSPGNTERLDAWNRRALVAQISAALATCDYSEWTATELMMRLAALETDA